LRALRLRLLYGESKATPCPHGVAILLGKSDAHFQCHSWSILAAPNKGTLNPSSLFLFIALKLAVKTLDKMNQIV